MTDGGEEKPEKNKTREFLAVVNLRFTNSRNVRHTFTKKKKKKKDT